VLKYEYFIIMSHVAAYHVFVCAMFPVQGGMWTPQRTHKYMICCYLAHNNEIFIF